MSMMLVQQDHNIHSTRTVSLSVLGESFSVSWRHWHTKYTAG